MAAELGWSLEEIRTAQAAPAFYEGVGVALLVRAHTRRLDELDVTTRPGMTVAQRTAVLQNQGARERLLSQLRGPD